MFRIDVTAGGNVAATPRLRLPAGTIAVKATANGAPLAGAQLEVHVLEGGGGFLTASTTPQPASRARVVADAKGEAQLPEFELGSRPEANRLLVQGDHAAVLVTVLGSYATTRLRCDTPASGSIEGVAGSLATYRLLVEDTGFPGAPVPGAPIGVDVKSGGGWLDYQGTGRLTRSLAVRTNPTGDVYLTHRLSTRKEQTALRCVLLGAPSVAALELTGISHPPRLLSSGSATRTERLDDCATGWLSKLARLDTVDLPTADPDVQLWGPDYVQAIDVRARDLTGTDEIHPEVLPAGGRESWHWAPTVVVRPPARGGGLFENKIELWLPDFPDDPRRTIVIPAADNLEGAPVGTTKADPLHNIFVESFNGGVVDRAHGITVARNVADVQYVGPNAASPRRFEFEVRPIALPDPSRQVLKEIRVRFHARTTPDTSTEEDPWAPPDHVAGTIGPTSAGGASPVYDWPSFKAGPGSSTTVGVYLKTNDWNWDHFVEATIAVTLSEKDGNGVWADHDYDTTILVRAFFPRPRLTFAKKTASGFAPIDDEAIVPTPVVDDAGAPIAYDTSREVYVELRCHDTGQTDLEARVRGGADERTIMLHRTTTGGGAYTLYRSDPVVFQLEDPEAFKLTSFAFTGKTTFVRVAPPYQIEAVIDSGMPQNTRSVEYWTASRPAAFLSVESTVQRPPKGRLSVEVPRPSIEFTHLDRPDNRYPVVVDPTSKAVQFLLEGVVRDVVGDVTDYQKGDIQSVTVAGQQVKLSRFSDGETALRPHAWRGQFSALLTLRPGPNVIPVEARNLLGGTTVRTVVIDLLDTRNDFADPLQSAMSAQITVLADPETAPLPALTVLHYRAPHQTGTGSTAAGAKADVATFPGSDTLSVDLTRDSAAKENVYRSNPILLVPDTLPAADYQAARAANVQLLRHQPGSRVRAKGTMPHPLGGVAMQATAASRRVEARVLVQSGHPAAWQETDVLHVGDKFTVELRQDDPSAQPSTMLYAGSCDRLGRVLEGGDRSVGIMFGPGPTAGWLRMVGYELQGALVKGDSVLVAGRSLPAPADQAFLRASGGGAIRIGIDLTGPGRTLWPIVELPARQQVGATEAQPESPRGTSSRTGARGTVVARTGELVLAETDATLRGRGLDLTLARTYRSFTDYDGPVGPNWSHNLDVWIHRVDRDTYVLAAGDGSTQTFRRSGGGFVAPRGVYANLEERSERECRLAWRGGIVQVFLARGSADPALLPLAAVYDRAANRVRLVYGQAGQLAAADDPLQQRLALRHDARGRLEAVGDATGRLWGYAYHDGTGAGSDGDLASVRTPAVAVGEQKFPQGKTHAFVYEKAAPDAAKRHKLTELNDFKGLSATPPLGPLLKSEFDASGRVKKQTYGKGSIGFGYDPAKTTVTDRLGHVKRFEFAGGPSSPVEQTCAERFVQVVVGVDHVTAYGYNAETEVIRVTSPEGAVTAFEFDDGNADLRARGNVKTVTRYPIAGRSAGVVNTVGLADFTKDPPTTQPVTIVTACTFETEFQQVKTVTDPLGLVTTHVYDYEQGGRKDGNLVEVQSPDVTVGGFKGAKTPRRTTWRYDNFGQPLEQVDANGVRTAFAYHPAAAPAGVRPAAPIVDPATPTGWTAQVVHDAAPKDPRRSASLADPLPAPETTFYDERGFPKEVDDALGRTAYSTFNELGQLVYRKDREGHEERFWIGANDRVVKRTETANDVGFPSGVAAKTAVVTHEHDYDRLGNQTLAVADSTGLKLKHVWEYDANENLQYERTPVSQRAKSPDKERYVEHRYDERDLLEWRIVAPGLKAPLAPLSMHYERDKDGSVTKTTDAKGIVVEQVIDGWARLVERQDAYGNSHVTAFDAAGRATREAVVGEVAPGKQTELLKETFVYLNEAGSVAAAARKAFLWDAAGVRHDVGRSVTACEHDAGGNVTATVSARGHRVETSFTGLGAPQRVAEDLDGRTHERVYEYDANGNERKVTLTPPAIAPVPPPIVLERAYDRVGRPTMKEALGKLPTRYYYDTLGRVRIVEDALGNRVVTDYDGAGRAVRVEREMWEFGRRRARGATVDNRKLPSVVTKYAYDENGNLLDVTDGSGTKALSHIYGSRDERVSTLVPDDSFPLLKRTGAARTWEFGYWPNGLLKTLTCPTDEVVTHAYDDAARLAKRSVSPRKGTTPTIVGVRSQTFEYDGANRCVHALETIGAAFCETTRRYDSLDGLREDVQNENWSTLRKQTASATYSAAGELDTLVYPDKGPTVKHIFDPAGRVVSVDGVSYAYDGPRLSKRTYPNGIAVDVYHGADGRMLKWLHDHHGSSFIGDVVQGEEITQWNEAGFPEAILDVRANTATAMVYDSFYRTVAVYGGIPVATPVFPRAGESGSWNEYDGRGNLVGIRAGAITDYSGTTMKVAATRHSTRTFNHANQMGRANERIDKSSGLNWTATGIANWAVSVGSEPMGTPSDFLYDEQGNLARDAAGRTFQYDALNRLVIVSDPKANRITRYRYDAFGRRLVKEITEGAKVTTIRFVYFKNRLLAEIPAQAVWRKRYLHGSSSLIGYDWIPTPGNAHRYWYHEDRTGSVRFLSDHNNDVVEQYGYDAYGGPQLLDRNGKKLALAKAVGNPFLSHSHYFDGETGLYHVGNRYYHPELQRMLQRDGGPWDDDTNAYSYARNNLHGFTDPDGNHPLLIAIVVGAAIGAALGGGLSAARQGLAIAEGSQDEFSWEQVFEGVAIGAAAGAAAPVIALYPPAAIAVGAVLTTYGMISGALEFHSGQHLTGLFDWATAVTPLAAEAGMGGGGAWRRGAGPAGRRAGGAAYPGRQDPESMPWGGPRATVPGVRAELARVGYPVPDYVDLHVLTRRTFARRMSGNTRAFYGTVVNPAEITGISLNPLRNRPNITSFTTRTGRINVYLHPEAFANMETAIATIGHELYEVRALRGWFQNRQTILSLGRLEQHVGPNMPGNFHSLAWVYADFLVERYRALGPAI